MKPDNHPTETRTADPESSPPQARNEVYLVGRVAAPVMEHELPSGATVVNVRLIVDRGDTAMPWSSQRVDAIECVGWSARVQRSMRRWNPQDRVAVEGSIRRRFFRSASGTGSRVEVEIVKARRLR
jgi:single-strand DNA-binding protein